MIENAEAGHEATPGERIAARVLAGQRVNIPETALAETMATLADVAPEVRLEIERRDDRAVVQDSRALLGELAALRRAVTEARENLSMIGLVDPMEACERAMAALTGQSQDDAEICYAIGRSHEKGSYTHGPFHSLEEALTVIPDDEDACVFEIETDEDPRPVCQWTAQGWRQT